MNPSLTVALGQVHQEELRRQADAARLAAGIPRRDRLAGIRLAVQRLGLRRRQAGVRTTSTAVS